MRGILIECAEMVAEMHFLEQVRPEFHDTFPPVNRSFWHHQNRVVRLERREGGGIAVVKWRVKFRNEREHLLA